MDKRIKNVVSCFMTIVITVVMLGNLSALMERKDSRIKYAQFFEQKEEFDVLFFGSSHVVNGVLPMELWEKYGIVSYNLGGFGSRLPSTYWTMENALEYTKPKVIVIDCFQCTADYKASPDYSLVHILLDAFPISFTKIRTVLDLTDDEYLQKDINDGLEGTGDEPRTKIGLLWNYSVYHSRWNDIRYDDIEIQKSVEKGAEEIIGVSPNEFHEKDTLHKAPRGTVGEKYLRRMIEECQDRDIEVLLTYIPFSTNENFGVEANYVYEIAREYGVNYLNFLDCSTVNFKTDFGDVFSHLNSSGARKVSDSIGKYLVENYSLYNHKNDVLYSDWKSDYIDYCKQRKQNLVTQNDIDKYLMLLYESGMDYIINVRNKNVYKSDLLIELLGNLGVRRSEINDKLDFIVSYDGKLYKVYDFGGEGTKSIDNEEFFQMNINEEITEKCDFSGYTDLQVIVFSENKIIDNVSFECSLDSSSNEITVSRCERN